MGFRASALFSHCQLHATLSSGFLPNPYLPPIALHNIHIFLPPRLVLTRYTLLFLPHIPPIPPSENPAPIPNLIFSFPTALHLNVHPYLVTRLHAVTLFAEAVEDAVIPSSWKQTITQHRELAYECQLDLLSEIGVKKLRMSFE